MDSDTLRPVAVALLCVLAIGVAAATLNSTVQPDSGEGLGSGSPDGGLGGSGSNGSAGSSGPPLGEPGPLFQLPCFPVLMEPWAIGLILGVFALGAYGAYRRLGGVGVLAYALPVGIPIVFVHGLLTTCTTPPLDIEREVSEVGNGSLLGGGGGAAGSGASTTLTDPSVLLLIGLGAALLAAVALLFVSSSGDDRDDLDEVPERGAGDVAAVGRAAGEAADRIEETDDLENEVYRAWREMTRHLDVSNPRSSTPAEFAAAAVEAGMAREDVDELTSLFEEVRYGGESPTPERERRALDALRNIEDEYADGGEP